MMAKDLATASATGLMVLLTPVDGKIMLDMDKVHSFLKGKYIKECGRMISNMDQVN